jgi:putative FmdB family regulatory protein
MVCDISEVEEMPVPFYRYQCDECCNEFSKRRRVSDRDDPAECPDCGSANTRRLIANVNAGSSGDRSGKG